MCCLYVTPAPVWVDLSSVYEANKCMYGYSRVMRVRDSGLPPRAFELGAGYTPACEGLAFPMP